MPAIPTDLNDLDRGRPTDPAGYPFPPELVLSPIGRWPTRLADATVHAVLTSPLPPSSDRAPSPVCPAVSIVIVTFNNLVFTRLCLESLLANTEEPDYEVVVVDNASEDGTSDYLRELARRSPQVRVLCNACNRGFAAANNQGLAAARGSVLVLLNNDTIVPPGWLPLLVRYLEDPGIGLVGPVTNRTGNEAQIEVPYRTYGELVRFAADRAWARAGECFDIRMLAMFCVALRREVYEQVGPLDERFGIGLFEDDDYALRARAAELRVVCAEDVFVHHFGQASIGGLASTGEYGKLFHANRRRWEEKWCRPWQPYTRRHSASYQQLTAGTRAVVDAAVPPAATVLVVSKGDEDLLRLGGRRAWHFPQAPDGTYAGHHPADSAAATAHLEELRARGADHLLFPGTAFWLLDFYGDFRGYLDEHFERIWDDEQCILFRLMAPASRRQEAGPEEQLVSPGDGWDPNSEVRTGEGW